jgi:LemA protein
MGKIALVIVGLIILAALFIGGWGIGSYNTLTTSRNVVDQQWSQVENQLQRRADLIPNLVNTVKGIANLEESVLTKIADARSKILSPTATPEEKMAACRRRHARPACCRGAAGFWGPAGGSFRSPSSIHN